MVWKKRVFAIATLVLLVAILSGLMVSPALGQQPERVKVLIGFRGQPGPAEQALVRAAGGTIKYTYHLVPAIAATLPEPAIAALQANPNVTHVDLDGQVHAVDAELDNAWGVKRIGAGTVHDSGNKGTGVKVAIIDSGIDYTHPDVDANCADEDANGVIDGYDFVNDDADPMDDYGHGTHVAGTVAAEDNNIDTSVVGVAPEAALYALKVLNEDGFGNWSDIIAAVQWCVDEGVQVANLSLGNSRDPGETERAAFDKADAAGVVIVAAAGNDGTPPGRGDNVIYPARYDSVIAVAATDSGDNRASWSSTGDQVELAAPGVSVFSTWNDGDSSHDPQPECDADGVCYKYGSGTSMASPHVAGTAALVIISGITDADGDGFINDDVRLCLQQTADDLGTAGWDPQYGYGLVDADEAAPEPVDVHDVAVTDLAAPPWVVVTDLVSVDVTLENQGTYEESFTVTLTDTTYAVEIGSQSVTLAAGATTTLSSRWDTTGATIGDHVLDAVASTVEGETDTADNSMTATVTVSEPPAEATMHVAGIDMGLARVQRGPNRWTYAIATVTIVDAGGAAVEAATVSGHWSEATSDSDSGVTDAYGKVSLYSDKVKNAGSGTTFTFTVDDVTLSGWTYDSSANAETSDSITIP